MNELEADRLRRANELAGEHKRELISILGQSNYAQICALEALREWEGAHILPSNFLGFTDIKGILDRQQTQQKPNEEGGPGFVHVK